MISNTFTPYTRVSEIKEVVMIEDIIKSILKNPIGLGIVGFLLFLFLPEIRVYIAIITVIVVIATVGKNGFYIYFAYSSLSALLSSIMSLFSKSSPVYQQLNVSVSLMTFASIGNIIDLVFYVESSGWNGFQNFLAFIVFGLFAF